MTERRLQVRDVLYELGTMGVFSSRETVTELSDALGLETRTDPKEHRRWTRSQLDQLKAAFILNRRGGVSLDELRRRIADRASLDQLVDQAIAELREAADLLRHHPMDAVA